MLPPPDTAVSDTAEDTDEESGSTDDSENTESSTDTASEEEVFTAFGVSLDQEPSITAPSEEEVSLPDSNTLLADYIEHVAEEISGEEVDLSLGEINTENEDLSSNKQPIRPADKEITTSKSAGDRKIYASKNALAGNSGDEYSMTNSEQVYYNILYDQAKRIANGETDSVIGQVPLNTLIGDEIFGELSLAFTKESLEVDSLGTYDGTNVHLSDGVAFKLCSYIPTFSAVYSL